MATWIYRATTIRFALPTRTGIELSVYNLAGQQVATLVHDTRASGMHVARVF